MQKIYISIYLFCHFRLSLLLSHSLSLSLAISHSLLLITFFIKSPPIILSLSISFLFLSFSVSLFRVIFHHSCSHSSFHQTMFSFFLSFFFFFSQRRRKIRGNGCDRECLQLVKIGADSTEITKRVRRIIEPGPPPFKIF